MDKAKGLAEIIPGWQSRTRFLGLPILVYALSQGIESRQWGWGPVKDYQAAV